MKNISKEEVHAEFRVMVKAIKCPSCGVEFSDVALDWGDAWLEGRIDKMCELNTSERDSPYKVKCELCGKRAWINYFASTARSAELDAGQ